MFGRASRMLLVAIVGLLVLSLLAGCGKPAEQPKPQEPAKPAQPAQPATPPSTGTQTYKMGTGFPGGNWYPASAKLAEILQKEIPGTSWSVSSTPGTFNLTAVNEGKEMQITLASTDNQYAAYNGIAPLFNQKMTNLRLCGTMEVMLWQIGVPRKSDIQKITDLKNKRINPGKIGSSDRPVMEAILKSYGITFDSIKAAGGEVQALGWDEAAAMMQDGHLDMVSTKGALMPAFLDLDTRPGLRFLPVAGPEIEALIKKPEMAGWTPTVLKKGMYPGLTEDVPTIGVITTFVCNKDLPDDFVYKVTKTIYESGFQKDIFGPIEAKGYNKTCNLEDVKAAANIPVHPGALKYFNEKGLNLK